MDFGFRLYFEDKTVFIPESSLKGEKSGDKTIYRTEVSDIRIRWEFQDIPSGALVKLCAERDTPLKLLRVDTLCLSPVACKATDHLTFFSNRWARSGNRYPLELGEGQEYLADCTGIFPNLASKGISLAVVSPFKNIVSACATRQGGFIEFCAKTEFTSGMQELCAFESECVLFLQDATIDALYETYRSLLPKSTFPMPKLTGWNTWDYYLDRVTPEDIYENIDALKHLPFADKLHYIVLDDGWQKEWGDWCENEKFSCGLEQVAKHIVDAGFAAGIWMAPLLIKDSCPAFRTDWLLKDESGTYFREIYDTCILDPTHPEARKFVLDTYKHLYSCGYRLFKIDYLSCLLSIKNYHDQTATPYTALARLIKDIQACTGPDAVILGCSLPIQCGSDIAPSMRIGVDIHNHFSHVSWIAESLTWTWMYNNRVTRIDPDFMIVRGEETADEPLIWEPGTPKYVASKRASQMTEADIFECHWRNGDQFNAVEAETWANLVAISGGNIFLSDRIAVLNKKGISILTQAFDAASECCKPIFLPDDRRLPSKWESEKAILLINWEDVPVEKTVTCCSALHSSKPFCLNDHKLTVTLQPHESFLGIFA